MKTDRVIDRVYMADQVGYVEVDSWTDIDRDIARIARVSTGSQNKGVVADRKLMATLLREDHGSPLEMGYVRYRLKMPLFVVMQLLRHRMASYSQKSGRYVAFEMEFWTPGPDDWRGVGEGNAQVSGGAIDGDAALEATAIYREVMERAKEAYNQLLELGVAREQARIVMPLGTYTELFVQLNVRSLINLLRLRMAPDAQPEFREYAMGMYQLLGMIAPEISKVIEVMFAVERQVRDQYRALWADMMNAQDILGQM